jgi:L-fuculose-phosphate aldolase
MNEEIAKQKVVDAGIRLVESGLIARTWGNVSCRVSETHFVITPSGRNYLTLSPKDIVKVAIADLRYEGTIVPSGEKGIHAEIYAQCPNVNFVIHTHQENASVLSAMDMESIPVDPRYELLGGDVPFTPYALPGTKKIRRGVAAALQKGCGNGLILKNHGAVCFGGDDEEAFRAAAELENACGEFIAPKYKESSIKEPTFNSRRTLTGFAVELPGGEYIEADMSEPSISFPPDVAIHLEVYKKNKKINVIRHVASGNVLEHSKAISSGPLLPLVDDFAQIIGPEVQTVKENPIEIAAALKHASAVFIQNAGALCCGVSDLDAQAVEMILEKCAKADLCGQAMENLKPIGWLDARLMRRMYLKKYSKQIG